MGATIGAIDVRVVYRLSPDSQEHSLAKRYLSLLCQSTPATKSAQRMKIDGPERGQYGRARGASPDVIPGGLGPSPAPDRMKGGRKRRNRIEIWHECISGQPSPTSSSNGRSAVR
jgi:hypothetical protein